mgnify:CR=1 FL=1
MNEEEEVLSYGARDENLECETGTYKTTVGKKIIGVI